MSRSRSAFTLLEVMIVVLILALVIAAAGTSLDMGQRFNERISLENELTDKVNRILSDVAMELRTADADPANLKLGSAISPLVTPTFSDYGADGYSDYTKLQVYQYRISAGIQLVSGTNFTGAMETTCHRLVYDPIGGTVAKELWNDFTTPTTRRWRVILCDQVLGIDATLHPRGGFFIDQIGNTLAMELSVFTTYRAGYSGETIIKVADSQVLFLRSTLDTNLGSAAYNKSDASFTGDNATTNSPTLLFGHLITYANSTVAGAATTGEVSIFAQPPIGQQLNNAIAITTGATNAFGVTVTVQTSDALGVLSSPVTMVENTSVAVSPYSTGLTRVTRPDKNGNVTVTLAGNVTGALYVSATAATKAGLTTTVAKTY